MPGMPPSLSPPQRRDIIVTDAFSTGMQLPRAVLLRARAHVWSSVNAPLFLLVALLALCGTRVDGLWRWHVVARELHVWMSSLGHL